MTEIQLHKEYDSFGENVQDLFDRTEEGFFCPTISTGIHLGRRQYKSIV